MEGRYLGQVGVQWNFGKQTKTYLEVSGVQWNFYRCIPGKNGNGLGTPRKTTWAERRIAARGSLHWPSAGVPDHHQLGRAATKSREHWATKTGGG